MFDCINFKIWLSSYFNVFEIGIRFVGDGIVSLCLFLGGNCYKVVVIVRFCVNIIIIIYMVLFLLSYVYCWNCSCFNFYLKCFILYFVGFGIVIVYLDGYENRVAGYLFKVSEVNVFYWSDYYNFIFYCRVIFTRFIGVK